MAADRLTPSLAGRLMPLLPRLNAHLPQPSEFTLGMLLGGAYMGTFMLALAALAR